MNPYTIPRANSPFSEGGGNPTREWYNFLRYLSSAYDASTAEVQAEITKIAYILGSPDGTVDNIPPQKNIKEVIGKLSVQATGTTSITLQLINDILSPGNTEYYGTNGTGVKGWYPVSGTLAHTSDVTLTVGSDGVTTIGLDPSVSSTVPYFIPSGQTYIVPINKQALFTIPIDIEGSMVVDGVLVEVD